MVLVNKKEQAAPLHHRKRQGSHHKRSKTYEKSYWPYLPLLAIAGVAMLLNVAWTSLDRNQTSVLGASTGLTNLQLLSDTNQSREEQGIGSLRLNSRLAAAAQAKAQDMASTNYWSHTAPDGRQPWSFAEGAGYQYQALGENLAYGFVGSDDVVDGWLNSQAHRANMLDPAYQDVGFGVIQAADFQDKGSQTIVVAMYGRRTEAVAMATQRSDTILPARQVSRVELVAANAVPGILSIVIVASTAAAAVFIFRHSRFIHRAVVHSEAFIVRHRRMDIMVVSIIAVGILLTRTAGFIH